MKLIVSNTTVKAVVQWLISRVAVIYLVIFLFCFACIDFKMLDMRIKTRHLNDAIPDFSGLIVFAKDHNAIKDLNWGPYKSYFELILSYVPDDQIARQLLGFVDYYSGHEQKAIDLLKSSSQISGHDLFWPNYDLGVIYYKKEMWPQAAECMFKAISASPQVTMLLIRNSIVYKQIFASPSFRYSLSEDINEAQSNAYVLLLSSLHYLRQYDKMIIISNLAIADPNLVHKGAFYYYAGLGFYETGQMQKAYLLFEKSLAVEKYDPDVYYYIGTIYQSTGNHAQAREFLQASFALHQKNDPRFPYDKGINLAFF